MERLARGVVLGIVAGMALLPSGCATPEQQIAAASQIRTIDDNFRPFREYSTGTIKSGNALGVGAKQLVGRVDRSTGALTTIVQFEIVYEGDNKRHYEHARNARAEVLQFTKVPRNAKCQPRKGCIYDELFLVVVPEAELRAAATTGYHIKAFARNGPDVLVNIPKELIVNLFAQIDKDRTRAAPA